MKDQHLIKQKLYHHTMPVPEDLWGKIEAQLPADKKRFPFFWFSMVAGLVGGGALVFLLVTQNVTPDKTPASDSPVETTALNLNNSSGNQTSIEQQSGLTNESSAEIASNDVNENNINESSISKNNLHYKNTLSSSHRSTNKAVNPKATAIENLATEEISATSIANFSRINHETFTLPFGDIDFNYARTGEADAIDNIKPDPNCYKFTGDNGVSRLSVDFFVGPGVAPRTFQDTGGETPQYVEARELTEHNQYAWSAGARVNYYL
ncbi:MAG: hypothetical protein ABIQ11_03050, partial [Saprospiraceae bacterium]